MLRDIVLAKIDSSKDVDDDFELVLQRTQELIDYHAKKDMDLISQLKINYYGKQTLLSLFNPQWLGDCLYSRDVLFQVVEELISAMSFNEPVVAVPNYLKDVLGKNTKTPINSDKLQEKVREAFPISN